MLWVMSNTDTLCEYCGDKVATRKVDGDDCCDDCPRCDNCDGPAEHHVSDEEGLWWFCEGCLDTINDCYNCGGSGGGDGANRCPVCNGTGARR